MRLSGRAKTPDPHRDVLWQILDAVGPRDEYGAAGFLRVSNWRKRQAKLPPFDLGL
jgi:hypothetical protein